MAEFHARASDQQGEFTVITDLSVFNGCDSVAAFSAKVWSRKRKKTIFWQKIIASSFADPKASTVLNQKCFTVLLFPTVVEQHAEWTCAKLQTFLQLPFIYYSQQL